MVNRKHSSHTFLLVFVPTNIHTYRYIKENKLQSKDVTSLKRWVGVHKCSVCVCVCVWIGGGGSVILR